MSGQTMRACALVSVLERIMQHEEFDLLTHNKHRLVADIDIKSDYEGAHSFVC